MVKKFNQPEDEPPIFLKLRWLLGNQLLLYKKVIIKVSLANQELTIDFLLLFLDGGDVLRAKWLRTLGYIPIFLPYQCYIFMIKEVKFVLRAKDLMV